MNDELFGQNHFQSVDVQFSLNAQNKHKKINFFCLLDFLHQETALFLVNISENGSSLNASKQNSFSLQTQHNLISEKHSELVEAELYRFHKKRKE